MIAALKGALIHQQGDVVVVDVGGVGYEVTVTAAVLGKLPSIDEQLKLVVFTDVKENSISLFGFDSGLEKEVFHLLRKVKGIGSRSALGVLSAMGPEGVLTAIGQSNVTALQKVPGIGRKTAERIIVELREHVAQMAYGVRNEPEMGMPIIHRRNVGGAVASNNSTAGNGPVDDAMLALEKLGFSGDRAKTAVTLALESAGAESQTVLNDAGELLKRALANL